MTGKERAFKKKVEELVKKANSMEEAQVKNTIRILEAARKSVAAEVASTEWEAYRLPQLKAAIQRSMQEFGQLYNIDLTDAQLDFWEHGINMVDGPIETIGIGLSLPEIDSTALAIMQGFTTDLVTNLTGDAVGKIQKELTMGIMGQKSPYEVMQAVGRNLKDKSIFRSIAARAELITRQECGRVLEAAQEARRQQAAEIIPDLGKEWCHAVHVRQPRVSHLAADGQKRKANEPFDVGGEKLMYPRDPAGSAKNTIGCNCYTIPWHPNWEEAAEQAKEAA
ncbi:MAG: hypothetical protein JXA07_04130 [Spirochaetes bacterium]|nr:hypothetical protein [Spirochaetota bacterium]